MDTPLSYAIAACRTMMRRYAPEELPPKGHFHYHQGVFLSGVCKTAALCGDEAYWQYAADWLRSVLSPDGEILQYDHADLDDIQPGILLFDMPAHDPAHAGLYRAALDAVLAEVRDIPRCACGGFYHKVRLTGQMWLDGLYMTCPFLAGYAARFQRPDLADLAVREILLMYEHTRDEKTGLWYHAWDETRTARWCDPETGLSPEFWGRSMGWVTVAILDVLDLLPTDHPQRAALEEIERDLLAAVCRYQGADGRWDQVVNKASEPGNWPENSCTCLFAAALAHAVRVGLLDAQWLSAAKRAFAGVVNDLQWDGENLLLGHVCIGTGVGDYAHYCNRPCSTNDLHGVGAFLLMCTELEKAAPAAAR